MTMMLTSAAFTDGGPIPAVHTCQGIDTSPPLSWEGLPAGTKSLALIVDDPDAPDPARPRTVWVHWVLWDIPPDATGLPPAVREGKLPVGTRVGQNDSHQMGYGGPCPPIGRHRYFHTIYALDAVLGPLSTPTKQGLLQVMYGHVIEKAVLIGTYEMAKQPGRSG